MNKAKKLIENTKQDLPDGISKDRLQALHAFYHAMINSQLQLIEEMEQGHDSA